MTNIVVPFNNQPDSVSIKTSSYTIPSGKYARVVVTDLASDFTIGGTAAAESPVLSGSTAGGGTGTTYFTNTTGATLRGAISVPAVASGVFQVRNPSGTPIYTTATATAEAFEIWLPPNYVLYQSGGVSGGTVYWDFAPVNLEIGQEFWVPTGTQLNGSRYIVELYNELT